MPIKRGQSQDNGAIETPQSCAQRKMVVGTDGGEADLGTRVAVGGELLLDHIKQFPCYHKRAGQLCLMQQGAWKSGQGLWAKIQVLAVPIESTPTWRKYICLHSLDEAFG